MHEIKIYGEIIPFEDAWIIEQGGYANLTSLQAQLKEAGGQDVRIRINSCGGDCDTGFAMYAELRRYAKEHKAKVETFGEARVASIATVIFLAGDSRVLTEHTEPFVHNAWTYAMGDSKTISRVAADLEKYNNKIATHYAAHTDLSIDEALELMNNETSITTEEAKAMRFCTEIEEVFRPAAMQRFTANNKPKNDMNKNPKTKSILDKAVDFLKSVGVTTTVNKLVDTADERQLDFYELEEDAVIEVGSKAKIEGADADGNFVVKSGETYVFVSGTLDQILPAEGESANEDAVALQAEIDALTEQLEAITNKATDLDAEVKNLTAENAKNVAVIAKFKNAKSEDAPADTKEKHQTQTIENSIDNAVANLKTIKLK